MEKVSGRNQNHVFYIRMIEQCPLQSQQLIAAALVSWFDRAAGQGEDEQQDKEMITFHKSRCPAMTAGGKYAAMGYGHAGRGLQL